MQVLGLDALLLFKVEDMYWLCGYESDGFCIFGCMHIGAETGPKMALAADYATVLRRPTAAHAGGPFKAR